MNPKKRAKKDLQEVNKNLNKPEYAKKNRTECAT